MGVADIVD